MAEVDVTPTQLAFLTTINFTTGGTAFTADGIKFHGNGKNAIVFRNDGAGSNTVTIAATNDTIEGFSISDHDIIIPAGPGQIVFSGKIGNQIASNQVIVNSTNPAEVFYTVLDLAA